MNKKVDDEKKFRMDMFKSKRKQIDEIWTERQIPGFTAKNFLPEGAGEAFGRTGTRIYDCLFKY